LRWRGLIGWRMEDAVRTQSTIAHQCNGVLLCFWGVVSFLLHFGVVLLS